MGLGGLPCSRERARGDRIRAPLKLPRLPRFQRTSFHQRIAPAAQRRNVHFEPVINSLLRFVMLAMREAGQLNTASHVAWIDAGSRELIQARVLTLNERSRDQGHSAANHVYGDYVETFFLVRRKLPEVCSEQ